MLKILKVVNSNNVRSLCVKRNLYTEGTNEEYSSMLSKCREATTDEELLNIGIDIWEHSNVEDITADSLGEYTKTTMLYELFEECVKTIFTEDDEG